LAAGLTAALCLLDYRRECAALDAVVRDVAPLRLPDDVQALALLHWVRNLDGTKRNTAYFAWPTCRATPWQVAQFGGDCADRALLLKALLDRAGLPTTRVMLFDPQTGAPVHTVVEARLPAERRMVLDPVFGLSFPRPQPHRYYGLAELRADPDVARRRVRAVQDCLPRTASIQAYPWAHGDYRHASTFNWEKNALTRLAWRWGHAWLGEEVYSLPRPPVLEWPQLLLAYSAGGAGLLLLAAAVVARRTRPPRRTFRGWPLATSDAPRRSRCGVIPEVEPN